MAWIQFRFLHGIGYLCTCSWPLVLFQVTIIMCRCRLSSGCFGHFFVVAGYVHIFNSLAVNIFHEIRIMYSTIWTLFKIIFCFFKRFCFTIWIVLIFFRMRVSKCILILTETPTNVSIVVGNIAWLEKIFCVNAEIWNISSIRWMKYFRSCWWFGILNPMLSYRNQFVTSQYYWKCRHILMFWEQSIC